MTVYFPLPRHRFGFRVAAFIEKINEEVKAFSLYMFNNNSKAYTEYNPTALFTSVQLGVPNNIHHTFSTSVHQPTI